MLGNYGQSSQLVVGIQRRLASKKGRVAVAMTTLTALVAYTASTMLPSAQALSPTASQYTTSDFVMQDYFDRTIGSGLGSAYQGGDYRVISGNFSVGNSEAKVTSLAAGQTAKAVLPSVSAADTSVRKSLIVPNVNAGTNGLWDAVEMRFQPDATSYRAKVAILNGGQVSVGLSRVAAGKTETVLGSKTAGFSIKSGQKVRYEARVVGTSPVSLAVRAWLDGTAEPAWQLVASDASTARISTAGALGLWSYASSSAPTPITFSHSSWLASKLVAPATTPTTTPSTTAVPPTTPTTAKPTTTTTTAKPTTTTTKAPAPLPSGGDLRNVVNSTAANGTVSFGTGVFTYSDFVPNPWGVELKGRNLVGAGVDKTVLQMNTRTSTKAGTVPTASMTTNQLSLLMVTGSPTISGFTLQGTDQGHLYNGLRVSQTTNARVSNVKVVRIPGNSASPPGETFGINDYRSNGNVYNNIEVDGAGVGAAAFGINSSSNITINGLYSHDNPYSHAITFWQTNNGTVNDLVAENNHKTFNFEQNTGTFNINRPKFGTSLVGTDLSVFSNISSNKIIISDPILAPGQKVRIRPYIGATAYGGVNKQVKSDIKVLVNGVDRTADLVQWQ